MIKDEIQTLVTSYIKGNTGLSTGKLTREQLDKLIVNTTGLNLIALPNLDTHWGRALLLIDAYLKPNDIEICGGYQKARLSYISEVNLRSYYELLDVGRNVHPTDIVRAVCHGIELYASLAKSVESKYAQY